MIEAIVIALLLGAIVAVLADTWAPYPRNEDDAADLHGSSGALFCLVVTLALVVQL